MFKQHFSAPYFSAPFMFVYLLGIGFAHSPAAETVSVSKTSAPSPIIPYCVNSEGDIAEIQGVQKAHQKTSNKYDGYRHILHKSTTLELAARLAYAETLAANCPQQEDPVIDLIASVIGNRIRLRHGDIANVVFQKDQFASSLNIYSESRYQDFLCPKNAELWNKALTKMRTNLEQSKPTASITTDSVNYYLYQHSSRFKAPNWKLEKVAFTDEKTRECIGVFRDPTWK